MDAPEKPQTPWLSRQGRRIAEAKLAAARFKPTGEGRLVRSYEVYGIAVTEIVSAEQAAGATQTKY